MDPIISKVALPLSLALIMFSMGLGLNVSDFKRVAKRLKTFSVGLFGQMVLLPLRETYPNLTMQVWGSLTASRALV